MRSTLFALLLSCAFQLASVRADSTAPTTVPAIAVHLKYASGGTELNPMTDGVQLFLDDPDVLKKCPAPLHGLMFTRRPSNAGSELIVDIPKDAKVFFLIKSGKTLTGSRKPINDAGLKHENFTITVAKARFDIYSRTFEEATQLDFPAAGNCSVIVAAVNLQVDSGTASATTKPSATPAMAEPKPLADSAGSPSPVSINLGAKADEVRTGGGGKFLVFHSKDTSGLTVVDTQEQKVVKTIPAEGDVCYCMDRNKLILVLNNQQVIQRWDLATLAREKTVMLPDGQQVKRAIMGSAGKGPLVMWTEGGCEMLDVDSLKPLTVKGDTQKNLGFGPWISSDGMTVCDWGWSSGPYSLMRLSNLTATSVECRLLNVDGEDYNESWAMPSADGTQLIRHKARVYDASTDDLLELSPGPLKDAVVLPTEDPRFLLALHHEEKKEKSSSVAILSACDRRVLYTLHKLPEVTAGMIDTQHGRLGNEPRVHYLPAENKLILIPNSDDKVVIYPLDLSAALKATGADYLYVISKPRTALIVGQQFDYQIETLSSAGGVKYKLEQGPDGLAVSNGGKVTWKAAGTGDDAKIPVVLTLSDASGQEITHSIELHVLQKPTPKPEAPAATPKDSTARAGKQPGPSVKSPTPPPAKKVPDDPELKALGDKLAKKFQQDLADDAQGNTEYSATFSVGVSSAQKSADGGGLTGHMMLAVGEDRAFLVGGDFLSLHSHVDIQLKKVNGFWTCTTAQSELDMATTSHGPLDLPFPRKTHDLSRSIRALLGDVQNDPSPPAKQPPPNQPNMPTKQT